MTRCPFCTGQIQGTDETCPHCGRRVEPVPEPTWDDDEIARVAALAEPGPPQPVTPEAATVTPLPAASKGLSRTELAFVVLAILAGGAITFGVLMARGAAPEAAAHLPVEHPGTGIVPDTAPVSMQPSAPKWTDANRARWVRNPRRDIAFELPAENKVQGWLTVVEPVLVVRCMGRRTEAFVYTATPAKIEPQDEDHTVGIAFDDEPQSVERWPDSAEHDALFAPDGEAFVRRLMTARTLRFGFTPHNARPVTVHFNVAGLAPLLEPAARQCGWKK